MKFILAFGLLTMSVSAFAGSRIETREHVLSEEILNVSECHFTMKSIRPTIERHFAYASVVQKVELYKVQVTSTSWWSADRTQFVPGTNQTVERKLIEEKNFSNAQECEFWSKQYAHAN